MWERFHPWVVDNHRQKIGRGQACAHRLLGGCSREPAQEECNFRPLSGACHAI